MQALTLFGYAFLSNVALAVLPHEPAVIWYSARLGVWPTTLVASAGTVAAALLDHQVFVPLIRRAATRAVPRAADPGLAARGLPRLFARAPFAVIALSGLTPLPSPGWACAAGWVWAPRTRCRVSARHGSGSRVSASWYSGWGTASTARWRACAAPSGRATATISTTWSTRFRPPSSGSGWDCHRT